MPSKKMHLVTLSFGLFGLAVLPATAAAGDQEVNQDLAAARAATATYHHPPNASADGYSPFPEGVPLHECITAPNPEHGAMGFHWLKLANVDTTLDPSAPEVLVYEPMKNGKLRLVAVEYVVFADAWHAEHGDTVPTLFGRELKFVPSPNRFELPAFYEVHAWLWKENPHGMFADHNTRVTCDFAD